MKRPAHLLVLLCLLSGVGAPAQTAKAPDRRALEVVGPDYTVPTPKTGDCDPYYYPPCPPGGGGSTGPNYGAGTELYAQQHFVPHMVAGGGFVTKLTLSNLTPTTNSGQLLYWGQDGSTIQRTSFSLPPGASMRLQTPDAQRYGAASVQWLTVSSQLNLGINTFFELADGSASNRIINTIGFNDPIEGTSFVIPVELEPAPPGAPIGRTVGVAIANDTSDPTAVTLSLVDAGGTQMASKSVSLAAFVQVAIDLATLPEFKAVLPAGNFIGRLLIEADHPVSLIALGDDLGPFYGTPPMDVGRAGELVLPHIVSGGGFVTKLTLLDLSGLGNALTVKFYDQGGNLLETRSLTLAPRGTGRIATAEGDRFGATQVMWATVTASNPAGVNLFFELQDSVTHAVVNTIGFNHVEALNDFSIPVEFLPGEGGGLFHRTVGIALANAGAGSAAVTLTLLDSAGATVLSKTLTLNAKTQTAIDLSTLPEFKAALPAGNFVGVVTVASSAPVAAIALGADFGPFYATPVMAGRAK